MTLTVSCFIESLSQIITRNTVIEFKVLLPGLSQFLATESPLQTMKNAFDFILKTHFVLKLFNPNLGRLFRIHFEVGGKITSRLLCLKFVRITPETWNLVRKNTHICSFRKDTFQYQVPLNFANVIIFFSIIVPLFKPILRELCQRFFSSVFGFCKIKSY